MAPAPGALVIRAPNHLGDLVMALPALAAAPEADVQVHRALAPLVAMAAPGRAVLPFQRGARGMLAAARLLRARRYGRGILLTPSLSSAVVLAAGGVRARRGATTDHRAALLTDPVPAATVAGLRRHAAYWLLVTGARPAATPVPRLTVPIAARARWHAVAPARGAAPVIGIFPGGNASSRRWLPARFAELARRLAAGGAQVVVFGGPAERALTAQVAGTAAFDAGGRTDLPLLAAALAACDLLVSNDSGPLHLAAAVGTRTISLWGAGDPAITAPPGAAHQLVRHPELPCVPCVRNACPRTGRGYRLTRAERECMALITTDEVAEAVHAAAHAIVPSAEHTAACTPPSRRCPP